MDNAVREVLLSQGVNLEDAMHRFLDMEEMYIKFLVKYSEEKSIENMKNALETRDVETVFKSAHSYKGLAGNLGLERIYGMASEVTELTRGKSNSDEVDFELLAEKIAVLCTADNEMRETIRTYFC